MPTSEFLEVGVIPFFVGQHERRRPYPVTDQVISRAHASGYDMVTAPITNDKYHARVLSQLSAHLRYIEETATASTYTISEQRHEPPAPTIYPLALTDSELSPNDTISQLILLTSPWIDLASPDPLIADISRQVLKQEITYAAFCGANNVLIRCPNIRNASSEGTVRFARAVLDAMTMGVYLNIHVSVPMIPDGDTEQYEDVGDLTEFARDEYAFGEPEHDVQGKSHPYDSWDFWHVVRSICRYSPKLSVALTLPRQLPSTSLQSRWASEPLRILNIHSSVFLRNARGNHVLSKSHQALINRYMRSHHPPWILLSDADPVTPGSSSMLDGNTNGSPGMSASMPNPAGGAFESTPAEPTPAESSSQLFPRQKNGGGPEPFVNYIRQHLERRQPLKTAMERFGSGYQDFLQNPLQPLTDNLESITYEVFERDPVKYDWYENAIATALKDWKAQRKPVSGPEDKVVIAVVGAGRGPLVTRALKASVTSGVDVDVWAVEKNPNAFVLLQRHNMEQWSQRVNLVQSDMRSWNGPIYYLPKSRDGFETSQPSFEFKSANSDHDIDSDEDLSLVATNGYVDIIISELLGSFADNELSPECLDGIQHVLRPESGISIPSSYTAHLTPLSAPKLHADVSMREFNGDGEATQIPYVVMLHAVDYLSATLPPTKANDSSGKGKGREKGQDKDVAANNALPKPDPVPVIEQVWEFAHPVPKKILDQGCEGEASTRNAHNARFKRLRFPCKNRGVCHGLGGYFEAVLYASSVPMEAAGPGDQGTATQKREKTNSRFQLGTEEKIELSTNPLNMENKSKDMISWFPIYFPLKTPLYLPDDSELEVSIWRHTDGRKVWYEWIVEAFTAYPVASGSKRLRLGMSELHSSAKNGYLM